ncbi:MAG: hypothetical protein WDM94_08550 [Bauldia sp.]
MPKTPKQNWTREFAELGVPRVRAMIRGSEWDREKKAAGRIWVETTDALAWQQKHKAENMRTPLMLRIRTAKWWRYAMPAFGALMGIGLLLRRLKAF